VLEYDDDLMILTIVDVKKVSVTKKRR